MTSALVFLPITSHVIINMTWSHIFSSNNAIENYPCFLSDTCTVWMLLLPAPSLDLLPFVLFSMVSNFQNRYLFGNKRSEKGLKILHWNKGSSHLQNKMVEIKGIVETHRPHVLGLSEANFLKAHDQSSVQLVDYNLHLPLTHFNPSLGSNRIVAYTHKSVIAKLRTDLMSDICSSIWLEIGLPRQKKFLVCQLYREWQLTNPSLNSSSHSEDDQLVRWLEFISQWELALNSGLEIHVTGDCNLNHLNWTEPDTRLKPLVEALFSRIIPRGVSQMVKVPTRHCSHQSSSGLDHFYTNTPHKISNVEVIYCGGSDHMLVTATRKSRRVFSSPTYIRKRSFRYFDSSEFVGLIQQVSWLDIYLCNEVDKAVQLLSEKITFILDIMAPLKTIQIRKNYNPWLSEDTKNMMIERDRLYQRAAESKLARDWKNFKVMRNKVIKRQRTEEFMGQKARLDQSCMDSSQTWKQVKNILNWEGASSPNQLFHDGTLYTKSQDIATAQNQFFLDKVKSIKNNLPSPSIDPLGKLKELMINRKCVFSLKPVHPDTVEKIIDGLSNSSSFGLDCIDTRVIKLIKHEILPALTHVINLSICSQKFPDLWKRAKVIPLHKTGDRLNPKNYRPVAILPVFSKILERAIFNQILDYLNRFNLLHPSHHAYREGHNTSTALIQMYDYWLNALEEQKIAGACLLDMSAAFDIVHHSLLLRKLQLYGFDQDCIQWISSYLSDRSQCVSINGALSNFLPVEDGVPQGSILGPLLYTLFTNELPEVIHNHESSPEIATWPPYNLDCFKCGHICCFADDTTYNCTGTLANELSAQLSENFRNIYDFLTSNGLKLNEEKTHLLVLTSSRRRITTNVDVVLSTGASRIEPSQSEKLLGIRVDHNLKWSKYILHDEKSLIKTLQTRYNALKIVCRVASFKQRKIIADGIFMSKLIYMIQVWGGCEKYLLKALQTTQNRAARAVTRLSWDTPVNIILNQCGWLSVSQLVFYHSVTLVHHVQSSGIPKFLYRMYNLNKEETIQTRQSTLHLLKLQNEKVPRNEIVRKGFRWRSCKDYNMLPLSVRSVNDVNTFKKMAKSWIKDNIPIM